MMTMLILVVSVAALLQFFISYSRSVIATSSRRELSEEARQLTGMTEGSASAEEFRRVVQLLRLCPEPGNDGKQLRAVRLYYGLLSFFRKLVAPLAPSLADWTDGERKGCAHFAAIALDRRIEFSRRLMAQQISNLG